LTTSSILLAYLAEIAIAITGVPLSFFSFIFSLTFLVFNVGPILFIGLLGPNTIRSALSIALSTSVVALAFSIPGNLMPYTLGLNPYLTRCS